METQRPARTKVPALLIGDHKPALADSFEATAREVESANKIKAHLKTRLVRNRVVMPSQLTNYLKKHVGHFSDDQGQTINWRALGQFMARELLRAHSLPKPYAQFGKRFFGHEPSQKFPAFNCRNQFVGTFEVSLNTEAWLSVDKANQRAELEVKGPFVGHGSIKKVFETRVLNIDLSTPAHRMRVAPAALVTQKSTAHEGTFLAGKRFLAQFMAEKNNADRGLRVAGQFTHTERRVGATIEARDKLFAADLAECIDILHTRKKVRILQDVARTLLCLHEQGLVHGDVKPANILVSEHRNRGYLNDFDFARVIGKNEAGTYGYVDALGFRGYATPFIDIFGLAMTTAVTIFRAHLFEVDDEGLVRNLSDDEIKAEINKNFLKMGPKQQKRVAALKENVVSVMDENRLTRLALLEDPLLAKDILGDSLAHKQTAIQVLMSRFKAFDSFLATLSKCY